MLGIQTWFLSHPPWICYVENDIGASCLFWDIKLRPLLQFCSLALHLHTRMHRRFIWKSLTILICRYASQEHSSIFKVCYIWSKVPYFHSAYLLMVPFPIDIAVCLCFFVDRLSTRSPIFGELRPWPIKYVLMYFLLTVPAQIERFSRLERKETLFGAAVVIFFEKLSENTVFFLQHFISFQKNLNLNRTLAFYLRGHGILTQLRFMI